MTSPSIPSSLLASTIGSLPSLIADDELGDSNEALPLAPGDATALGTGEMASEMEAPGCMDAPVDPSTSKDGEAEASDNNGDTLPFKEETAVEDTNGEADNSTTDVASADGDANTSVGGDGSTVGSREVSKDGESLPDNGASTDGEARGEATFVEGV